MECTLYIADQHENQFQCRSVSRLQPVSLHLQATDSRRSSRFSGIHTPQSTPPIRQSYHAYSRGPNHPKPSFDRRGRRRATWSGAQVPGMRCRLTTPRLPGYVCSNQPYMYQPSRETYQGGPDVFLAGSAWGDVVTWELDVQDHPNMPRRSGPKTQLIHHLLLFWYFTRRETWRFGDCTVIV